MKKNKTILFFSAYHLPHLGGVEKYTDNLGQELIKNGYKVIVLTSKYDNNLKTTDDINGIKIYRYPIHKLFKNRYPILKKNNDFKSIFNKIDNLKIDAIIVNCRFYLMTLFAVRYAKKRNIPCYVIEHGSHHLTVNNKVLDFFGAIYEHFLTFFVKKYKPTFKAVSLEAGNWQKHFKINCSGVWYNSIYDFSNEVKKVNKDSNSINVLYAGRIIKQKGVYELIKAFEKLEQEYNNIKLTIAGDGDYLEELKGITNSKNIDFIGKVPFEKLKYIYAKTHIFVYATLYPEGLPTSILEAGICKCAVIGSPQGGTKEIVIDNETGLMVNSEDELYKALKKLINNSELRTKLGNNLYKYVTNKFLFEKTARVVIKDIESR